MGDGYENLLADGLEKFTLSLSIEVAVGETETSHAQRDFLSP